METDSDWEDSNRKAREQQLRKLRPQTESHQSMHVWPQHQSRLLLAMLEANFGRSGAGRQTVEITITVNVRLSPRKRTTPVTEMRNPATRR